MEGLKEFLSISSGYGNGYGNGYGDGYGNGNGYGNGYGDGYGDGYGNGNGYGDGDGYDIKSINGVPVHQIDGVATIINRVRGNVAKGAILQNDLTTKPCYVVKNGDHFAHGETIAEATRDAESKACDDMSDDERVDMFIEHFNLVDRYPASEFVEWHGKLTGSCEMGRNQFVKDRGIDLDAKYTVSQFIEIVKDAYGSEVVRLLQERTTGGN